VYLNFVPAKKIRNTMNQTSSPDLFSPVTKYGIEFSNAIVMAPMTRSRALGSVPNDLMATYYQQRAGAGLIITEGNSPSPNGIGYARTPGIYSDEQIEGWKKVTNAVHAKGGKIFSQLMHVGRVSHSANMPAGAKILAPSAIQAAGDMWTDSQGLQLKEKPQAMTSADIKATIAEFARAAIHAVEAGFDGVELHGANGYLLEQFLNPHTNQRTDTYGGSVENRSRFALEVTEAVANAIGKNKVGMRLSPYNVFNDMGLYPEIAETYAYLAEELSKQDILYLHVIDYAARTSDEGLTLLKSIRRTFSNLLILNGGYSRERAEQVLHNGEADMVSFGTPFIANPDLHYRLKHGIALQASDPNTFYTPDSKGYTDYAFA
jgi:N-ethylmaleimide reductase